MKIAERAVSGLVLIVCCWCTHLGELSFVWKLKTTKRFTAYYIASEHKTYVCLVVYYFFIASYSFINIFVYEENRKIGAV